jgi:hypothetical protein
VIAAATKLAQIFVIATSKNFPATKLHRVFIIATNVFLSQNVSPGTLFDFKGTIA